MRKKIKKSRKKEEKFSSLEVVFLCIMTTLLGLLLGVIMCYCKVHFLDSSDEKLQEIISTYNSIVDKNYGKVDKDELSNAAISGMVNSLDDPYSTYYSKEETKSFNDSISGYYEGIGITITKDDSNNTQIVDVAKKSPASKAGIKTGDTLLYIDSLDASKVTLSELVEYVSDAKDRTLTIKLSRDGKELEVKLKRAKVEIESVHSQIFGNLGYIDVDTFSLNTGKQFNKQLNKLIKEPVEGLIIDLRDNGGGHLGQVKEVVEPFFKENVVIYQIENKHNNTKVRTSKKDSTSIPIVVLINGNSASASEIVASCLKENYKNITLVGTMTYGKGTIQKEVTLSSGASIKYTTQRWLTSKGKWLDYSSGKGLKPDVEVDKCKGEDCSVDLQLEKAKEILNKE